MTTVTTPPPGDPSWWFAEALTAERPDPARPLEGRITVDAVIVGGGYTGLWTALALKQRAPQMSIAVIEAALCGAGASGKNGGKVSGYWSSLAGMLKTIGPDGALAVARAGARAQDAVRAFATAPGRDVWWREGGSVSIAAAPAQDSELASPVEVARLLGVADTVEALTPLAVARICASPVFRGGVFFPEGATVQPARLVRALRQAVIEAGVAVYETTPMIGLDKASPNRVRTPRGEIITRDVVLATNAALARDPAVSPHVSVFSSYALMTEPDPDRLEQHGWRQDVGATDCRMFIHYFRKTPDGRVLMGTGSGPISFNGSPDAPQLREDVASAARAARGLHRLLPAFAATPIAKSWGGPIEVSADRLPFFRTMPGTRVHYGCGYSGHGVNPAYIGGQCLASLVLDQKDDWTALPFCTRTIPRLPPEPFRYYGGRAVRWGILTCEEAQDRSREAPLFARAIAALPRLFGLKIGTR